MAALQSIGLVLVLAAVVSADVQWPPKKMVEKIMPILLKCMERNPLDDDIINKARSGNIADDPKVKVFLLCVFDAFDSIDHQTGELLHYKLMDLLPDPETQQYVLDVGKDCLKIHEPAAGDTAYKFVTCMSASGARFDFF